MRPTPDILVVDDNSNNLGLLSDMLQQRGYRVRVATNGRRALEVVRHERPGLILLDINMPEMDGFEVCAALKRDPALADVPVLFISAHDDDAVKVRAFSTGGADYIQKPFQTEEVLARVEHHLRLASLQQELQANNQRLEAANARLQTLLLENEKANERLESLVAERTSELRARCEALKTSEERSRLLFEFAPEAILVVGLDPRRIVEANPRAERLFGATREQLLGSLVESYYIEGQPDGLPLVESFRQYDERAAGGGVVEFQRLIQRKDGEIRRCEVRLVQAPLQGQRLILATYTDITERKRQEDQLAAYQNRLEATLDAVPDLLFEMGLDGRYYTFPSGKSEQLAAPGDGLLGRTVGEVLPQEAAHTVLLALREAQETGRSLGRRIELDVPQGRSWFELSVARKATAPAEEPRFIVLSRDITERVRSEQERIQLENQLFQSQKIESLGLLAGGIAHDINNMLGAIMGHLEMLRDKVPASPAVDRHFTGIQAAADRSKDIVKKVLAFSRKDVFTPQPIDLNAHIAATQETLAPLIGEDIQLSFWPGENLWPIFADASQIDQILMNLVLNARDAMPGGGSITLETANRSLDPPFCQEHPQAFPGEFAVISVRDTGTGMDPSTMARIFEPFFTTKEAGVGTGLGLSTLFGIVKQNGGFVTVASELRQGSTFEVYLPRMEGLGQSEAEAEAVAGAPARGQGGKILLVEDDGLLRNVITAVIQKLGFQAIVAESPEEALGIAAQADVQIDILLTDVIMPGMNGRALQAQFERLRPGVPTLFMSGYTAEVIARRGALDEGVNLIRKPFTLVQLAEKLDEIGLKRPAKEPRLAPPRGPVLGLLLLAATTFLAGSSPPKASPRTGPGAPALVLKLNTADVSPLSTPAGTGINDRIVTEACRRIGVRAELVAVPYERALLNADQGIDDGNFVRVEGVEKLYPHLVRVPEKICDFEFTAFSLDPALKVSTWEDLKPYHVGIITGWKILEANIAGTKSLTKVRDPEALFGLLVHHRADLVVFDRVAGEALVQEKKLSGVTALAPPLTQRPMFIYLNQRHAHLVPGLAQALRGMKRDGTLQRMANAGSDPRNRE